MTIAENKSAVGVRDLYAALVTQDDAYGYAAATPEYLAPAVNVNQSPTVNTKPDYADDGIFDVLTNETESKIEIEVTAFTNKMLAKILGKQYDDSTGRMFDDGGTPPDMALSFRSMKSNGKYRYRQYLKGRFSAGNEEAATKADSPDPKHKKITFTAYKTIYQFTGVGGLVDGVKKVDVDEDSAGASVAGFFSAVQVPVVGSAPAFTVTPTPADAATGQATTVAIMLTFSNALAGNAELGVGLIRVDTGATIAVTRSLNAARLVLTLTHAALVATKQYFITLYGVKDIYGQTLADVTYDFTIA